MLSGKAKTDYMREYMRWRRASVKLIPCKNHKYYQQTCPMCAVELDPGDVRPVRPQKELTYERDDYSQ